MESVTIESTGGIKLNARIFRPPESSEATANKSVVVVLVHPFTILGGFQGLMKGIAKGIAERGGGIVAAAVTFDLRGAGRSTGKPSFTGSNEVDDVVSVCRWVIDNLKPGDGIVLVGSSAGAPIAGSAVDKVEQVVGYVSLGYPFGFLSSILLGRHYNAILRSPKPKLFVMGTQDGFTSVKQLQNKLKSAAGRVETRLLEGVGHFQMEGPAYDAQMVEVILDFIQTL